MLDTLASVASFVQPADLAQLLELAQANLEAFFADPRLLAALCALLRTHGPPAFASQVRDLAFRDLRALLRSPDQAQLLRALFALDEAACAPALLEAFARQAGPASSELKRILDSPELCLCLALAVSSAPSTDYVELYRLDTALHALALAAPRLLAAEHTRLLLKAVELCLEERS